MPGSSMEIPADGRQPGKNSNAGFSIGDQGRHTCHGLVCPVRYRNFCCKRYPLALGQEEDLTVLFSYADGITKVRRSGMPGMKWAG